MKSMTGFGKAVISTQNIQVDIEIKSVNSKYLDLRFYMPRELSYLEPLIREKVSKSISRGSVEVKLNLNDHREPCIDINTSRLLKYRDLIRKAAETLQMEADISLASLLSEPGMIENQSNPQEDDLLNGTIMQALDQAIGKIVLSMSREGEFIASKMLDSVLCIEEALVELEKLIDPYRQELFESLNGRITSLLGSYKIDTLEQRIMQEMALYIDKYDIHEEINRLHSHITTFKETLRLDSDNGKTLHFITQEMQREANTLGSKFSTKDSFQYVLRIKEEIEKCREIVLNVA